MIILASASPRRRELLSIITESFKIVPAKKEEAADASLSPSEYVIELASAKAREVAELYTNDTVIGSDTVVVHNGSVLGKPVDKDDAKRMLTLLSGQQHSVFTGVTVIKNNSLHSFCEETEVTFYKLSPEEIERYAATGEPLDKAGAYGIQGKGALLVEKIVGDYYNVMGLPIGRLCRLLKELGEV